MLNFMTLSLPSFKLPDHYRFIIIIIIDLYSTIRSYSEALAAGNVYQLYR